MSESVSGPNKLHFGGEVCGAARVYRECNEFRSRGPGACYECGYIDGRKDELEIQALPVRCYMQAAHDRVGGMD